MPEKPKYNEDGAINALLEKRGVDIDQQLRLVIVHPTEHTLGNKSWGKVDYLTGHQGYNSIFSIDHFKKKKKRKR